MHILRTLASISLRNCSGYLNMSHSSTSRYGTSANNTAKLRVLVDMDQVICDFEGHFLKVFREKYPDAPYIPLEERRTFYINDQYEHLQEGIRNKTEGIIHGAGFFRNLPPLEDSIEAVKEMSSMKNVDVFLCTSPLSSGDHHCVKEKFEWVEEHMGRDWTLRLILTRDKTVVNGHLLIDDKPKIKGSMKPMWDHILFTACHNKHLDATKVRAVERLENWTDGYWRQLVDKYKTKVLS